MSDEIEANHQAAEFMQASQLRQQSLLREFTDLLRHNKKWWLTPILLTMAVLGAVAIIGSSSAAPFVYALF